MYHTRVFVFDFQDDKLPKFTTDEELQAFYAMVGRMAMYGCHDPKSCDTIQFASGYIDHTGQEMIMSYRTIEAQPEKWEDGSRKYIESPMSKAEAFKLYMCSLVKSWITIGAVKHDDGRWSFHS